MSALKAARDWLWRTFAYASWVREEERRETEARAAALELARAIERDGRTFNSATFVGTEAEKRAAYQAAHAEHIAPFEALIPDVIAADEEAEREREREKAAKLVAWHEERLKAEAERAQKKADEVAALDAFAPPGTRFVYLGVELVSLGTTGRLGEAVLFAEHIHNGAIFEARFGSDHLPALRSERWRAEAEDRAVKTFGDLPPDWRAPHD